MLASNIEVWQLNDEDLAAVECLLTTGRAGKHHDRLEHQRMDEAVYLIAWGGSHPVGHVFVKFGGAAEPEVRDRLGVCPTIEDVWVRPERRREGIGSLLMSSAERSAAKHGFHRVGLGVSLDNPRARALYERLGYHDSGIAYTVRYRKSEGFDRDFEEQCTYLVKDLRSAASWSKSLAK